MATILIIEDNPQNIERYKKIFASKGFEVATLDSHGDVAQKACALDPAVVIMNVIMGGTNGLAIMEAIHQQPQTKGVPIIMLTIAGAAPTDKVIERRLNHVADIARGVIEGHRARS